MSLRVFENCQNTEPALSTADVAFPRRDTNSVSGRSSGFRIDRDFLPSHRRFQENWRQQQWLKQESRPRLQRRDRDGIAPSSLLRSLHRDRNHTASPWTVYTPPPCSSIAGAVTDNA